MNLSELINEILSEWAYRVDDGQPNPKNKKHLAQLSIVLSEMGLSNIKDELFENITVLIKTFFDTPVKRVATGAAIPSHLQKHIYFETQKKWRCFVFLNQKPKFSWEELEMICEAKDHKF